MTGSRAFVVLATSACVLAAGGCSSDSAEDGDRQEAAARLQSYQSADYAPLDERRSLATVAESAQVVGIGHFADVRLAYAERLGEGEKLTARQMFLVIEPDELQKGAGLLGSSGMAYLDVAAPPRVDGQEDLEAVDALREAAVGGEGTVVFMLDTAAAPPPELVIDEFEGRQQDDPLLAPSHPSAVLAVEDEVAFPLLTDEQLTDSPENLSAVRSLGIDVDRFTVVEPADLDPASP